MNQFYSLLAGEVCFLYFCVNTYTIYIEMFEYKALEHWIPVQIVLHVQNGYFGMYEYYVKCYNYEKLSQNIFIWSWYAI